MQNRKNLKFFLFEKLLAQFENNLVQIRTLDNSLPKLIDPLKNKSARGLGQFFLCICRENY